MRHGFGCLGIKPDNRVSQDASSSARPATCCCGVPFGNDAGIGGAGIEGGLSILLSAYYRAILGRGRLIRELWRWIRTTGRQGMTAKARMPANHSEHQQAGQTLFSWHGFPLSPASTEEQGTATAGLQGVNRGPGRE